MKYYYSLLLDELLNNKSHNKVKPIDSQKVNVVKPKSSGINQFHNHITGKDVNKAIKALTPNTIKIFTTVSI